MNLTRAKAHSQLGAAERASSDIVFVATTILVVFALTTLPYLFAYWTSPPDKQFMGIMLDVPDHVQYFSWMRELATAPLAANKLTPEPNAPLFFNLLWWGLGRLGRWTGLGYAEMYQILRLTVTVLFPIAAYRLCAWFLPDRLMRRTAFLTIMLTSGWGWILVLLKYTLAQGELWFPLDVYVAEGNTFLGILGYPHFIGAALYITVFELVLQGEARRQLRYAVAAGLLALFLAWQHAYDLISIYGVLAAYAGLQLLRDRRWPVYMIRSGLIVGLISFWPALYSVLLTSADPLWGAVLDQFVNAGVFTPGPLHLPILLGPAFLLAVYTVARGKPLRLTGVSNPDLFLRGWFLITFVLIYLPVEYQIHLLNGWQVPIGILATIGLFRYLAPAVRRLGRPARGDWPAMGVKLRTALSIGLIASVLPTNLYLLTWRFVDLARYDYPYYLHQDEVEALGWLDANAEASDVIFASLTVGQYVPAWTGSPAFLAHWAQTVDFFRKAALVDEYFVASTTDARRWEIIQEYGVKYIFYGPAERRLGAHSPDSSPFTQLVFGSPMVQVYKVLDERNP